MRTLLVIPARLTSTRLPEKPLVLLEGKTLVQHAFEVAARVPGIDELLVAADDARIVDAVRAFGGEAILTSREHRTGTERVAEVARERAADLYVNLQCDEPLARPADVARLVEGLRGRPDASCATLFHAIDAREAERPSAVKIVVGACDAALYFSRAPIPFPREPAEARYRKHVGIYAYRREFLARLGTLAPPMEERAESLEQLRFLHAGERMVAFEVEPTGPGVDTPEDLEVVRRILRGERAATSEARAAVRVLFTDVDGVLTDGGLFYDAHGEALKRFHVRDGTAVKLLQAAGIRVVAISGRAAACTRTRLEELGLDGVLLGVGDKAKAVREYLSHTGLEAQEAVFVGDDRIDLPGFEACGEAFAPADAVEAVRSCATHVCRTEGGSGVLREVAEYLLARRTS